MKLGALSWVVCFFVMGAGETKPTPNQTKLQPIEKKWDDLEGKSPKELGCVAKAATQPVLVPDQKRFYFLEIYQGKQSRREHAGFLDSKEAVQITYGGCYHTGAYFVFTLVIEKSTQLDPQSLFNAALERLDKLKLTDEGNRWRESILSTVKKHGHKLPAKAPYTLDETKAFSWVSYKADLPEDGVVKVHLSYEISL